jgi:hypothetical protein
MKMQDGRRFAPVCGCLLLLAASSCKKSGQQPSAEIFGEWQWVSSVGGLTGKIVLTPASTGRARTYRFNRDSTFVECFDNRCEKPVKFKLRTETSFFDGKPHLILTIPRRIYLAPPDTGFHVLTARYTVQEISNTVNLVQERPDGFTESYVRK